MAEMEVADSGNPHRTEKSRGMETVGHSDHENQKQ